jgi:hypothetical protein
VVATSTFVAGLGLLVTLDLAVLAISVTNARQVGTDKRARRMADEAHERLSRHLRRDHGWNGVEDSE